MEMSKRLNASAPAAPPTPPPPPAPVSLAASCVSSPSPPRRSSPRRSSPGRGGAKAAAYNLVPPRSLVGTRRQLPQCIYTQGAPAPPHSGGAAATSTPAMWRVASLPGTHLSPLAEMCPASHPQYAPRPLPPAAARWSDPGLLAMRAVSPDAPVLRISGDRCVSVLRGRTGSPAADRAAGPPAAL